MSMRPGGFSRYADYDEVMISLLRRIDAAGERRNRELYGPWSDHWTDVVKLAQDYLSPIVKIYTDVDLGDMAQFMVRQDPSPDGFVHELSRHPRSFIELGVPTFLNKLVRNLERVLSEVGPREATANNILELAFILKETARIFPDKLPKSSDDAAEAGIDEEEGKAALDALKEGKQVLRDEYYRIKEAIEAELNATDPEMDSRDRRPRDDFQGQYETQDFGSGWDDRPRPQRHRSAEYNAYQEEETEDRFPQRHHSGGGFSARPAPRAEGARTGRPMGGSGLSPAAFSTIPVRPQGGGPSRSNSGGFGPVRRPGGYSARPPPPSTDLRKSVSDNYRNQSNWEPPEQDSSYGWDSGSGNRGSHSTRGYSSRATSNVRRDQRNGGFANSTSQESGGWGNSAPQESGGWTNSTPQESGGWRHSTNQETGSWNNSTCQETGGWGNSTNQETGGWSSSPAHETGGWGTNASQDTGSSRRSKKESKPKSKTPKSSSVSEPGWGSTPETKNETNNAWNNATGGSSRTNTDSGWGGGTTRDVPQAKESAWGSGTNVNESTWGPGSNVNESSRGAGTKTNESAWGSGTNVNESAWGSGSNINESAWGAGTNVNESAWGSGNNWTQSTSNTQETRGAESGWVSSAPATTTAKRGPPPGFGPPPSGGNSHPSYPPGFGPRDGYEGQGEGDMEAAEQYY